MDQKFRDAVAGLACQARNAARLMVRPAATGFVENRVFFQEAYEALQGALDAYEEALSDGGTPPADASLTVNFEAADRQLSRANESADKAWEKADGWMARYFKLRGELSLDSPFVCRCTDPAADALGICRRCGGFEDV